MRERMPRAVVVKGLKKVLDWSREHEAVNVGALMRRIEDVFMFVEGEGCSCVLKAEFTGSEPPPAEILDWCLSRNELDPLPLRRYTARKGRKLVEL